LKVETEFADFVEEEGAAVGSANETERIAGSRPVNDPSGGRTIRFQTAHRSATNNRRAQTACWRAASSHGCSGEHFFARARLARDHHGGLPQGDP